MFADGQQALETKLKPPGEKGSNFENDVVPFPTSVFFFLLERPPAEKSGQGDTENSAIWFPEIAANIPLGRFSSYCTACWVVVLRIWRIVVATLP